MSPCRVPPVVGVRPRSSLLDGLDLDLESDLLETSKPPLSSTMFHVPAAGIWQIDPGP
jgi:hypothetical protein